MKLTDYFDRVYIINLPYKEERRKRLWKHLLETGIADPSEIIWQTAVSGDLVGHPEWWGAGNGAWGCLMSHLQVVLDATMRGLQNYCVLEDDVVFQPDAPERLERFMNSVPVDWGQIYLGGQYLHQKPEPVNAEVWRPYNINRTHAFALNRDYFGAFQRHIMHAPDYGHWKLNDQNNQLNWESNHFHIDHQLGVAHQRQDWPVYTPPWWIAGQEEGDSNVSGRTNPRHWWHFWGLGSQLPFVWVEPGEKPVNEKILHFGWSPSGEGFKDAGVDRISSANAALGFADTIANEAIGLERLPAIECSQEVRDWLKDVWEPGVIEGPVSDQQRASIYTRIDPKL